MRCDRVTQELEEQISKREEAEKREKQARDQSKKLQEEAEKREKQARDQAKKLQEEAKKLREEMERYKEDPISERARKIPRT